MTSWPTFSRAVLYAKLSDDVVGVRFRRLLWFGHFSMAFRLSQDGMRWYHEPSGVRLMLAPEHAWTSLYNALGKHP
jgi:hypothetical protein